MKPEYFILDCDGVLTDGSFYYNKDGKIMKKFGPDDGDSLNSLKKLTNLEIHFISGDWRGIDITRQRCADMGFGVELVQVKNRLKYLEQYNIEKTIFMADGICDYFALKGAGYSIVPNDASIYIKGIVDYVTPSNGGSRSVSEACIHIFNKFFYKNREVIDEETIYKFLGED